MHTSFHAQLDQKEKKNCSGLYFRCLLKTISHAKFLSSWLRVSKDQIMSEYNVWFIKIRTIHNLSLWLYEYFWMILPYGHCAPSILHYKGLGLRNLQYEMRVCQKSHNKSQRQFRQARTIMNQTLLMKSLIFQNTMDRFLPKKVL